MSIVRQYRFIVFNNILNGSAYKCMIWESERLGIESSFCSLELYFSFYWGKARNITFTIITILKCIVQQCSVYTYCCKTDLQISFLLKRILSPLNMNFLHPFPPALGNYLSTIYFCDFDYFRYFTGVESYSIHTFVIGLFH